jgi:hypothetical protein
MRRGSRLRPLADRKLVPLQPGRRQATTAETDCLNFTAVGISLPSRPTVQLGGRITTGESTVFEQQPSDHRELESACRSIEEERENCLRRRALGVLFTLGESREEAAEILRMALTLNAE